MKLYLLVLTVLGLIILVKSFPIYFDSDSNEEINTDLLLATDTETGLKFGDKLYKKNVTVSTNIAPIVEETHLLTRNKKTITINDNDKFDLKIIPLNDKVEILKATETTTTEGERTSTIIHDELRTIDTSNANKTTNVSINSIISSNTFTKPNIDLSFLSPILFHVEPDLNANLTINVNQVNDSQVLTIDDFRIQEQTTLNDSDVENYITEIPNETTVTQELKITTSSTISPDKNIQKKIDKIKLNQKIAEIEANPVILTQGV